ncbi:colicin E3/pyocin S6 family cytotoxin [Vibrio navarrensis]|uniref:colicin E3/pyocin S6 family cytotoxin n=1 Tax=Vibrio navarrensis TaxID=29495 RepID=UPI001E54D51A|nr:colicin E3/pyocin S6 family cytotoxin [Vibrio navarrensis]
MCKVAAKKRPRWKDKKRIYEWDSQHGKVEVYDKNGNHIGEFDHETGEQTKPKDPKRKVEK